MGAVLYSIVIGLLFPMLLDLDWSLSNLSSLSLILSSDFVMFVKADKIIVKMAKEQYPKENDFLLLLRRLERFVIVRRISYLSKRGRCCDGFRWFLFLGLGFASYHRDFFWVCFFFCFLVGRAILLVGDMCFTAVYIFSFWFF